jgi:hypothetical protein
MKEGEGKGRREGKKEKKKEGVANSMAGYESLSTRDAEAVGL